MKTPQVKRYKIVLFCNKHKNDCDKLNKQELGCKKVCEKCRSSEKILEHRFT